MTDPQAFQPLEEAIPLDVFRAEVEEWAKRLNVSPREIRVRSMKRKLASCSPSGCLTFNSGLLTEPARVRREVIVHELLHLRLPNHGKLFKQLLKAYLERYEE